MLFETYKDLLTSVNGVTITYDETTLNPISIGNDITLSFKGRDLSEYIDVTNNIYNKYYYDYNGNRVLKEEYDSNNNLVKSIRYYYVKNVLGNILAIIDNNKSKVVEYSYNAWGEVTSTGGTLAHINPFRYKGYYYDSDIKMYYCKIGSTIFSDFDSHPLYVNGEISKEGAMSLAMQVAYIFLCSPVNTIADLLIRGKED